ncbi:rod shape-determining protein RodA [Solemya pervernicosa gill symbiont]|uniref:Peptidoglycan glycosyltransferase MrdB n=2 Tax=Gammaproteobacteria incertae sedis TaxID=118884 RepID=A0A1T2L4A3_9GAMM|nr:rod shape-determining protein RodA [Candidatus Reidiella endopervernicosa]OOZ39937.1 rod shape-determining protein RodA [Solemya pervernicosa gill symbiont]
MRRLFHHLHIDVPLLLLLMLLAGLGMVVLYSASGSNGDLIVRQVTRLSVAFIVLYLFAQIPPQLLRIWTPWLFTFGILLLIAVLAFGYTGKGAQRWLDLGLFKFQPSEILKITVPMMVAWYLGERPLPPDFRRITIAALIVLIPTLLIAKQPDLGTSLLIACSGFFVLFLAGLPWRLMFGAIVLMIPASMALWFYGMHAYQRQRVLTFLNPEQDPLGSGYHIIQSKIAIGSGGIYGKGWLNGTQSQLDFLPERSTDFIFAVLSEEFGLVGVILLLVLYMLILLRTMHIATQAQDTFTRLLAGSLGLTFFIYVVVNTGMVTGLLPVVGLPLPLISYGGTSMVTLMAAFGILMSVHTHRKLLPK